MTYKVLITLHESAQRNYLESELEATVNEVAGIIDINKDEVFTASYTTRAMAEQYIQHLTQETFTPGITESIKSITLEYQNGCIPIDFDQWN